MPREVMPDREPVAFVEEFGVDSGRIRHDSKITVYLSAEDLHVIEKTRADLRDRHGVRVDRGRLVRIAVAQAVADYRANGTESDLWRRLKR